MKLEENNIIVKRSYKTVYKCDDSIVKVFNEEHPKSDVFNEALITARIEETGLDIPKVKGVSLVEGKLIFHSFQKRRCFAVNLKLKVYKIFHILLNILFVGIHHIFHCLSVFILYLERPLAFNQGNSFHLRNIQSCFFDPRRDQSFRFTAKHLLF